MAFDQSKHQMVHESTKPGSSWYLGESQQSLRHRQGEECLKSTVVGEASGSMVQSEDHTTCEAQNVVVGC